MLHWVTNPVAPPPLSQVAVSRLASEIERLMATPGRITELFVGVRSVTSGSVESNVKWKDRTRVLPTASTAVTVTFTEPSGHPAVLMSNGEATVFGPEPLSQLAEMVVRSVMRRSRVVPARTNELFEGLER